MTLAPGGRLGAYEIISPLGAGGMGEVYRARDTRLRREVAVKVLPASFAADADRLRRFEQEALATAALNHPNILTVYDVGRDGDTAYVVLELLEGRTLREVLTSGPLPVRKSIEIGFQMATGLAAAHTKGIVHRDLKPENVFVTTDERVKILDFGLAKVADTTGSASTVLGATEPGTVLGTAGYMSPEQVRGLAVDHRSDIFSLGAILYELVSGHRTFGGDTAADVMSAVLKDSPPDLVDSGRAVPIALDRVIRRCLEKNPAVRFQSASDLAFALNLEPSSASAPGIRTDAATPAVRPPGRWRATAALVGAGMILAAGAAFFAHDLVLPGPARATDVRYQRLTFDSGFVFAARFAKDRRMVVYSADWDKRARDVYVTSLDTSESRPLGLTGTDLLGFTPLGDLALLANSTTTEGNPYLRRGTLAISSITGGAPREIEQNVFFADPSADRQVFAIVRQTDAEWLLEFPYGQIVSRSKRQGQLFIGGGFVTPRISPDAAHVAVMTDGGSHWRLQIFGRDGRLAGEDPTRYADWWGLAWRSPSEIWVAGTETFGNQTNVYSFSLSGRRRLVYRAPGALTLHDVSDQGDVLATFDRGASRVELQDRNGVTRDLTWLDGSGLPSMSDTGVVVANQFGDSGGGSGAVMAWPPGASQPVRISGGVGLAVSLDGTAALVSRTAPQPLRLVPIGPGQERPLDIGPVHRVGWAGWHPDGRLIINVARPDLSIENIVVPPGGGRPATLLPADLQLTGGRLISPDGAQIVAATQSGELQLCALPGAKCRPLAGSRAEDYMCGWIDNRSVILRQGRSAELDLVDIASGRRSAWRQVRTIQPAAYGIRFLTVLPDSSVLTHYTWAQTELQVIKGLR